MIGIAINELGHAAESIFLTDDIAALIVVNGGDIPAVIGERAAEPAQIPRLLAAIPVLVDDGSETPVAIIFILNTRAP